MDLLKTLKQFKNIEADPYYTRVSKRTILGTEFEPKTKTGIWRMIIDSVELGSSMALASMLILLVLGGFALGKYFLFPSVKLASLDPQSLRAEAEEIDFQIKLANSQLKQAKLS